MFAVFTIVQSINTPPSPSPHHLVVISWIHISFCTKQIMIESKPESSSSFWQSDQLFRKPGPANVYNGKFFKWNFYLCAGMCIILLSPIRGVRRGWHTNTTPTLLRNRSLYKQHHKGERGCCIYEDTEWRKYNIEPL